MVHWGSHDCNPPLPTDDTDACWRAHLVEHAGVVGLSSIKEDNVEEWMWRLTFLQHTLSDEVGCLMWSDEQGKRRKDFITITILRRWVGLWTNWSNVKRAEFVKLRMQRLTEQCDLTVRREVREADEAAATPRHSGAKGKKKRRAKA